MGFLGRFYKNGNGRMTWTSALRLVAFAIFIQISVCSLPLTKPCGETECQPKEYCRQHDHICRPCTEVCDTSSNNFDENRCVADCQDYIHDERYLKLENSTLLELQRSEMEEKYKNLEKDVLILKILVAVCIAVIAIVVACLVAFLIYFWKLMHPSQPDNGEKKKQATAIKSVELPTVYNNRYGVTTPTPETSPTSASSYNNVNNNSSASISPADTNITTVSSSASYPAGIRLPSPTKSESSVATPGTATTTLSTLVNGKSYSDVRLQQNAVPNTNRFRREPSESTLPENCAYDNLSMSPQHSHTHYSHHV